MDIERDEDIWVFSIGNIVQDIGTVYQIYHCEYKKKSTECVSLDTQILFFLSTIARAFWVNDTYLRKVFISNIELFCSFIIHTYFIVYVIMSRNESTMNQLLAVKKRFWERWYFLAVITFGLGFFIHPSSYYYYRNYLRDIQMCVSFNIFTDAASLIPQLPLIYKEGDVGSVSRTYVIFLFIARCIRVVFWLIWEDSGYYIYLLIADGIYLACVGVFVLSFCGNVNKMILPIKNQ